MAKQAGKAATESKKKTLILDNCSVKSVSSKVKDAVVVNDIKMGALFTSELARLLGVEHALYRERRVPARGKDAKTAKQKSIVESEKGIDEARLTFEMGPADVILTPKGLTQHEIEIRISTVHDFRVKRQEKGGLRCLFKLRHTGSAIPIVNYLEHAGEAPATVKITTREEQTTIDDAVQGQNGGEPGKKRRGRPAKQGGADARQTSIDDIEGAAAKPGAAPHGAAVNGSGKAAALPEPDDDGFFTLDQGEQIFSRRLAGVQARVVVVEVGPAKFVYGYKVKFGLDDTTHSPSIHNASFRDHATAVHAALNVVKSIMADGGRAASDEAKANGGKVLAAIVETLEAAQAAG